MLVWLILIPILGGLLAWNAGCWSKNGPRWIALLTWILELALALVLWGQNPGDIQVQAGSQAPRWLVEAGSKDTLWVDQLGITFHLAADGLSLLLILLTAFIGIISVAISWTEIQEKVGFFHFNICWVLAGVVGVFTALDLFLFYFFWELMLIPMYLLIGIWGHENRHYAAIKFFIFTQASGLLMLVAILGLYFVHGAATGVYTFNYMDLLGTEMPAATALWLSLGFFIGFVVKLPMVPLHTWLPDAHTEAPTAGSVILAALLLKTGAYGLLRFVGPLFPQVAMDPAFVQVAMWLGVVGIIYGAVQAFAQTDLKRLVAYTSVSHLGFVLVGIYAWNQIALQGAVMQMICHGISTGALFILVGSLYERIHTRDMTRMGGLWTVAPRMGAVSMVFALASLGLPGMGNFIAEILILMGIYKVDIAVTAVAALGLVAATVYALIMFDRSFYGPNRENWKLPDLSAREIAVMAALIAAILWLGLYPQPILDTARPALKSLVGMVTG